MIVRCKQYVELTTARRERALSLAERIGCWIHLLHCKNCPSYDRQIEQILVALKKHEDRPISNELRDKLLAAYRSPRK